MPMSTVQKGVFLNTGSQYPLANLPPSHPAPVRPEFSSDKPQLTLADLKAIPVYLDFHKVPVTFSDHVAYKLVKALRYPSDLFFKKKYLSRAVMLETVAACPGMFSIF